jgi:hypothetical protein
MIDKTIITNEAIQVLLTGVVGDGCIYQTGNNFGFSTNCLHKEYVEYKYNLVGDLRAKVPIRSYVNRGKSRNILYTFRCKSHPIITEIALDSLENNLNKLTSLGLAMWFYDDGTLENRSSINYKLHTHAFTEEEHHNTIIPYFNSIGLYPRVGAHKKPERISFFLVFNKYNGCESIINLLRKYPVECYKYKTIWDDEEIKKQFKDENYIRAGKQRTHCTIPE